jgi:cytoskeleton protein RodZ
MSDEIDNVEAGRDVGAPDQPPPSYGLRLKWERERAGLSVTDVAARLRLHPKQVRALEQETLDVLPEAAYVRGFVRSYARILNVDPAPLLADLGSKLTPAASVVDGMARPRDYSPVRAAAREQASRMLVIVGAVVLLIVLGTLGWYATRGTLAGAPAPSAAVARPASAPAPAAVPPVSTPAPVAAERSDPATAAPEPPVTTEPVLPAPLLRLRFTGPSWVEVKDTEGKVLLSQHAGAGVEHVVEGTPPFYVVIGDAGRVAVEVRGETYELAQHTRQNVARFTIN